VLRFALGVSVVAGLACGLAPALWQSRVEARGELAREAGLSALGFNVFRRSRLMAGTLAVVGIYGGIAFAVSRRTREIGIRMALGASRYHVFRAIVGDMLLLAGAGIAAGVAGGAMLTRYLDQMLFDLTPLDPADFIATPVVLASAVMAAALLSARPALTVAPLAALRHE
jgi:ABC-type antimicrobial peptide transport system permease subunit